MRMSSSKKYLIIFAIISLLLIIAVNIYFYERYNNFQENRKQKITKEFHLQKNLLEYRLEEMFASSYLERKVIEKYLIQDENNLLYNDYNYSISNSNGKGIVTLSLDSGSEKGNIVLHKDFAAEIDLKNSQRIKELIQLLPIQHLLIKDEEFVEWSVFYTPDYFTVVPNINLDKIREPLSVFESVKNSLAAIEKEGEEIYQKGWETSVFRDQSDQALIFSKNLPLKKNDRYFGILSSNISINQLNKFIKHNSDAAIYISNSYDDLIYADGEKLTEVKKLKDYFPEDLIKDFKFNQQINFMKFEGDHYITSALKLGDWNLIYDLNDSLFNSNRIYFEIIFANFLLFSSIIIIFNLLSNNIKLEAQKREMLLKEANYDELTGLYNKKKFFEHARVIFENAERGNIDFALAMIDLDDFKLVNDQYGHMAGDHILKKTAQLIKNNIRKTDLAARFGGEEFCLVLTGVNKKAAYQKIEEIRKKIAEHNFIYQEEIINVTVSAGISLEIKDSIKSMIIKADKLLYKSKKEGKNRTTID